MPLAHGCLIGETSELVSDSKFGMSEASGANALDDVSKDLLFLILAELENYPQLASAFESLKARAEEGHAAAGATRL